MRINEENLERIVYNDKDGNRLERKDWETPEGAKYYVSSDSLYTEKHYVINDKNCKHENVKTIIRPDGKIYQECTNCHGTRELNDEEGWTKWDIPNMSLIIEGRSTWNENLVLAMANSGDYTLKDAITIVAKSCERCLNVLLRKYCPDAEDNGYEEFSKDWYKAGTVCDFCRHLNNEILEK